MQKDYRPSTTSRTSSSLEVRIRYPIPRHKLDQDAVDIIRRLVRSGYQAYLVGGCIRDVHQGLPPKDFDVVTSARPNQIKKLFRNCRVIGRRFRLAHIHVHGKIIEVATFRGMGQDGEPEGRSPASAFRLAGEGRSPGFARESQRGGESLSGRRGPSGDNVFGTAEEDAMRRDFTINGLYYDVDSEEIIDFVGGFSDLRRRVIRAIGDPEVRLIEDPVRMIRAIKLAAKVDFQLDPPLERAIRGHRRLIRESSPARILEELFKILGSGAASRTLHLLSDYRLLEHLLPEVARALASADASGIVYRFLDALDAADQGLRIHSNPVLLAALFLPVLDPQGRALGLGRGAAAAPAAGEWIEGEDLHEEHVHPDDHGDEWNRDYVHLRGIPHLQLSIRASRLVRSSPILRNLPRRDLHLMGQILVLQHRLATTPRTAAGRLVRKEAFGDALRLFQIACTALRCDPPTLATWRGYLDELPRAAHRRDDEGAWRPGWIHDEQVDEVDFDAEFDEDDGEMAALQAEVFPEGDRGRPRRRRSRRRRRD